MLAAATALVVIAGGTTLGIAVLRGAVLRQPSPPQSDVVTTPPAARSSPDVGAGRIVRWIMSGRELPLLRTLAPDLVQKYIDTPATDFIGDPRDAEIVPAGWSGTSELHATAAGPCDSSLCHSITTTLRRKGLTPSTFPDVFYDDEVWNRTPLGEQRDPCGAMRSAAAATPRAAHTLELGPDQNLAELQPRRPGETTNWQVDLRLGLAACGAPLAARYHIMSQAFETPWCKGGGDCKGSEQDFVDYVTQTWIQARAANPGVRTTAGLGTNGRYNATPQAMYQDMVDTRQLVDGYWLNVAGGPVEPEVGIQFLELVDGGVPLYLLGDGSLTELFPDGAPALERVLGPGESEAWLTSRAFRGGSSIPAGAYRFEPWTKGNGTLSVEVGVCGGDCSRPTVIVGPGAWTVPVGAAQGAAVSHQTAAATAIPAGADERLFVKVKNASQVPITLVGGSRVASTNLAIPRPSSWPIASRSSVLVPRADGTLGAGIAGASAPAASWPLASGSRTFVLPAAVPAGTIIPAGAFALQTTAEGSGTATLHVDVGVCTDPTCAGKATLAQWDATVGAGRGVIPDGGAATSSSSLTTLASSRLYVTLSVIRSAPITLMLGGTTPTNLASPIVVTSG